MKPKCFKKWDEWAKYNRTDAQCAIEKRAKDSLGP